MRSLVYLLSFWLLAATGIYAQTTFGSITGTVTDPSGLALAGAKVQGTERQSGYKYQTQSNQDGNYTLPDLREGAYDVVVTAAGFSEARTADVQLASREIRRLDVQLQVGSVTSTVEVKATPASVIETETARISQDRTALELRDLPLNTRSVTAFLSLMPGVGQATTVTATYRFNGSRRNQSEFTIDGISNITYNGTQVSPLTNYIESFQEVRIDSADNTAEAGAVGQVTVISKSGTNQLHGTAFDYYVTPAFRARDFFSPTRASGISHRPGAAIGGPVYIPHLYNGHDKTFFFFDYETSQGSTTQNLLNPTVPLTSWRSGDFSNLLPTTKLKNPFGAAGATFAGNMIPANLLNPVALKIQNTFYPTPNGGNPNALTAANYISVLSHTFDPNNYWTTRIDHRLSDKTFFFGRYTWQRNNVTDFDGNLPTIGRLVDTRDTRNAVVSWSQIITSSIVNELRYGYAFTNEPRHGPQDGQTVANALGLTGLVPNQPNLPGLPTVSFSGLALTTIQQTAYGSPDFYNANNVIQDQMTWTRGKHTIRAGTQIGHYHGDNTVATNALYGNLQFSNRYSGFAYADFLLGLPSTTSRAPAPLDAPFTRMAYDFFITDEYKITPRLTANVGMRYELHPSWGSTNGLYSLFDISTGKIVIQDGSQSKISALFPANYANVVTASQAGYCGNSLICTDKNNFAPRVGVAWRPFDDKTVLRAGFGIFYDIVPTQATNSPGAPFQVNEPSYTNPSGTPVVVLPNIYPSTSSALTSVNLPGAFKKDLRIPYTIQYNVTVEREIAGMGVRISYIGTGTRQGEYAYNYNQPLAGPGLYINKPKPFGQYPGITYTTNGAGHQYNGLNTEVKRRLTSGLLYDFSWTYARDVGDLERDQSPEDAYNLRRERAPWADIPTHRITNDLVYLLPFGHGRKYLANGSRPVELLAGGWEVTQTLAYNTGFFLTPQWQGPDPTGTAFTSSSTPATVTIRPNVSTDPNLSAGQRSLSSWYNVGAFSAPSAYFGTSAKGVIVGPDSLTVNAGIAKQFNVTERFHVRAEFTGTNILNRANFGLPGLTITSAASAGVITASGGGNGGGGLDASGARAFRAGLRVEF